MLKDLRVKAMSYLLNLGDVILRDATHQLHQMVQRFMTRFLKPTRLFAQVIPNAQLHGIGKKGLRFKRCTRLWLHGSALQLQASNRIGGQLAGIGLTRADQIAFGLHVQANGFRYSCLLYTSPSPRD